MTMSWLQARLACSAVVFAGLSAFADPVAFTNAKVYPSTARRSSRAR